MPTTALNALSYLYDRHDIPPIAIQRIFMYCLDSISVKKGLGHGTSSYAIALLGNWLNEYQQKTFKNTATYLSGENVHFRQNNKIIQALNLGGAALLSVTTRGASYTHFVLALRHDSSWIYTFDPYPKTGRGNRSGKYEFLAQEHPQAANLRIHRVWLETIGKNEPYQLGAVVNREVLLVQRTRA